MSEWARQGPPGPLADARGVISRHFCILHLPWTITGRPQDVNEAQSALSFPSNQAHFSSLSPLEGDNNWTRDLPHLTPRQAASSLAFFAFFLPASPSSLTPASSHSSPFTIPSTIHSKPGCSSSQPRIRVGCAPSLPWIRVLPNLPETTNPRMPRYPVTYCKIKSLPSAAGALCIC